MRILRGLDSLSARHDAVAARFPATVVTIGNFDGVHLGHQRLLETVVRRARRGGTSVAMTFEPHPVKILRPELAPRLLTTLEQKLALLEAAHLDVALLVPFTLQLSRLSPREFAEGVLARRLGARLVCVGANFRFGHRHAGDVPALQKFAREFGFEVEVIPPVLVRGRPVSSSLIRRLLNDGEIRRANALLGRPCALTGEMQRGAGRGRTLGFPTLNFVPEQECLPARGVYVTETLLDGRAHRSVTNVGTRPTFDGRRLVVESHLLDFGDEVGRGRLEVRFLERLREEKKFAGVADLRAQIARDVARARRFFARPRKTKPAAAKRV